MGGGGEGREERRGRGGEGRERRKGSGSGSGGKEGERREDK